LLKVCLHLHDAYGNSPIRSGKSQPLVSDRAPVADRAPGGGGGHDIDAVTNTASPRAAAR
jgi:hypothetical protein